MIYTVTRACNHEEDVTLYSNAEWRLENVEPKKLCHACYVAKRAEERRNEAATAAKEAQAKGWPTLEGSEKQVQWAETLRIQIVGHIERFVTTPEFDRVLTVSTCDHLAADSDSVQQMRGEIVDYVLGNTTAHWWIEHKDLADKAVTSFALRAFLGTELQAMTANDNKDSVETEDILTEATVMPETPMTQVVTEVRCSDGKLVLDFPDFQEAFQTVVKSELRMGWDKAARVWYRRLVPHNGLPGDRAAEAGYRLLAAGFPIRIFDPEIRAKAIAGDFTPEHLRWVVTIDAPRRGTWFALIWPFGEGRALYDAAKKIHGAKYQKPHVIAPPESFAEVLDFARMYDFRVAEDTQALADAARERRAMIPQVSVAPLPDREAPSQPTDWRTRLEVPTEVAIDAELAD